MADRASKRMPHAVLSAHILEIKCQNILMFFKNIVR